MAPKKSNKTQWNKDLEIAMLVFLLRQFMPRQVAGSHWKEAAKDLGLGEDQHGAEAVSQHWHRALGGGTLQVAANGRAEFVHGAAKRGLGDEGDGKAPKKARKTAAKPKKEKRDSDEEDTKDDKKGDGGKGGDDLDELE